MQTVVIYDTKFGNTEKIAEAIARGAGAIGGVHIEAAGTLVGTPDLVLVGGPTQGRAITPALRETIETLGPRVRGVPAAAFDTRYRGATLIMGSAARDATKLLGRAGAKLVAAPESFYMARGGRPELQTLEAGELERAEAWGRTVVTAALEGAAS